VGLSVHDPLGVPKTYQRANANDWSDEDRLETEPIVFPVDRQTGANRAALDWAWRAGSNAAVGRRSNSGEIPLIETPSASYADRTMGDCGSRRSPFPDEALSLRNLKPESCRITFASLRLNTTVVVPTIWRRRLSD